MWRTARKPGVRFVHLLLWKHFPNSIRLLWTFVKGWPVWIKENKQPHPHFNFWSLNGACQYRDEGSWAGGKALGAPLPNRWLTPREQQAGDTELWVSLQLAEMPMSPLPLRSYWVELGCIGNLILELPGFSRTCWSMAGGLDYPVPFLPAQLCCWSRIVLDLHFAQVGHAAREAPKAWPSSNGSEMTVVSLNLSPELFIFYICSCWEMKSKHLTSVF